MLSAVVLLSHLFNTRNASFVFALQLYILKKFWSTSEVRTWNYWLGLERWTFQIQIFMEQSCLLLNCCVV